MVQEITTQSWGSRIMSALIGILIGIALIIGSFVLIFWNEGNGLHTSQSLEQTQKVLISVPNSPIDSKNNLKVVYFTGLATTKEILTDPVLGVAQNAIKLNRKVEMYQWQQNMETKTEKQLGGSEKEVKTYTYQQVWSDRTINSSAFKEQGHENPAQMPLTSLQKQAEIVTVGDFHLPSDLISDINGSTSVDLSKTDVAALQQKLSNKTVLHNDTNLYVGADPQNPKIGDLKIEETVVLPQAVSVISQQTDNTLQPYMAPAGKSVSLLSMGTQSSEQIIHDAIVQNQTMTWILRLVSFLLMVFGVSLLMRPVVVLADVVPFLGTLVGVGTGLIAFVIGLALWSAATAIAWFAVRPLWALGLIVVAMAACYFLFSLRKKPPVTNG